MSVTLAHLEPDEVTLDDLRNVIDSWADREPQTRANATSALRSFWKWAEEEGHVERSPAHLFVVPSSRRRQWNSYRISSTRNSSWQLRRSEIASLS